MAIIDGLGNVEMETSKNWAISFKVIFFINLKKWPELW